MNKKTYFCHLLLICVLHLPVRLFGMKQNSEKNCNIRRLTLVTDAWKPQVNGVVTTLSNLVKVLENSGIEVDVIQPNDYPSFPLPSYNEIRCVWKPKGLSKRIREFQPDAIHIATEGTLGWFARSFAKRHKIPFTSGYHTRYPEYVRARWPIPTGFTYYWLKRFHGLADKTLVPAQSILDELEAQGFSNLHLMSRGVDCDTFQPLRAEDLPFTKPMQLYVGRIAPEKNIEAFLQIDNAGSKVLIGDGPDLEKLKQQYPSAHFLGVKKGEELAKYYASADVFVFPSKTDTFGVVNIEAIACGTPVAAYPVTGPKDIISEGLNGSTNDSLETAINNALQLETGTIHLSIPQYTWSHASQQFLQILSPIDWQDSK